MFGTMTQLQIPAFTVGLIELKTYTVCVGVVGGCIFCHLYKSLSIIMHLGLYFMDGSSDLAINDVIGRIANK